MAADDNKPIEPGWRVFGLGIIAFAVIGFVWGDFLSGQPAPKWIPERTALAYAAATFMLVAGAAIQWRRAVHWAAAAIISYFSLIVLLLENGRVILKNYAVYGAYFGAAEPISIIAGALIVYAATAPMDAARAARLTRMAQVAFGVCAIFFGGAHFVYLSLTAPLIPRWLPPSQDFWAYATGVFHIMAGVAIITGIQARLGAILAAVMYALFIPLVFVPVLQIEPTAFRWTELATTIVLIGVAWTVADSRKRR
ncbi:MAG TPA: DoxX family membrane protein [Rhizomicrobium sp.]|nr:DoxX family membrane protein [Rhizomicrobium sp.]